MSGTKLKLYNFFSSSCSFRVRIALAHKGIQYEYISVNIQQNQQKTDGYEKLNPMRQVPVLKTENGVMLQQSLAIMNYLEERFPDAERMLPDTPEGVAKVRAICELIASGVQPIQNLGVLREIKKNFGASHTLPWAQHWITNGFTALEQVLLETSGKYCYGDTLTLADCCLVPQVFNATEKYNVSLEAYPTIKRVAENCFAHPSVVAAHPSNQPDSPPQ
eukprot:TRINITY_DN7015_c1_g2_i1.p1 TRINITY_DN7015_c1_g2~~TRINITY_DN7015_c1_g2_i1.p1  ORF type:complete len:219 (+),score=32.66 TRINITY_DN7015_c1_g2_i1:45-701(+)